MLSSSSPQIYFQSSPFSFRFLYFLSFCHPLSLFAFLLHISDEAIKISSCFRCHSSSSKYRLTESKRQRSAFTQAVCTKYTPPPIHTHTNSHTHTSLPPPISVKNYCKHRASQNSRSCKRLPSVSNGSHQFIEIGRASCRERV